MPKRVGFLYGKMLDIAFIKETIIMASKRKRGRRSVQRVLANIDEYAEKLLTMLEADAFVPAKPRVKQVYDQSSGKWREIKVVPFFPDACVHWLCVQTMKPVLMRGMHHWSCASIPGRGGARAVNKIEQMVQCRQKDSKYAAQCDVRKFYDSIPPDGVRKALERKIKDKRFIELVMSIIQDGLAIGYYICQWLANFYLEGLDRLLCKQKGITCEIRYMDNVTMFSRSKRALHKALKAARSYLATIGLSMKGDWAVFPIDKRAVDAIGYRFNRSCVIFRKRSCLRFMRQCRRATKRKRRGVPVKMAQTLMARIGRLKVCASKKFMQKYVRPIGVKYLKGVISRESTRRRKATRMAGGKLPRQTGYGDGALLPQCC